MNFDYPDFLQGGPGLNLSNNVQLASDERNGEDKNKSGQINDSTMTGMRSFNINNQDMMLGQQSRAFGAPHNNDIWFNQFSGRDLYTAQSPTSLSAQEMNMPALSPLLNDSFSPHLMASGSGYLGAFDASHLASPDTFKLPSELQGGVSNISSRRPSYAAESFTRSSLPQNYSNILDLNVSQGLNSAHKVEKNTSTNLSQFAMANNFNQNINMDSLNDSLNNISLNQKLNDFQNRRPSQLVDFQNSHIGSMHNQDQKFNKVQEEDTHIQLENGLILKNQYIIASPNLKKLYEKTSKYFQDITVSEQILVNLKNLLLEPTILKLITFVKNLNNLTFNHKVLCLVVNKNGKLDLLSYPNNSNIYLQKGDLVIVDGDRGKDMVTIVEPLVNLNFAILFNFLKKIEHLKSLTIVEPADVVSSAASAGNKVGKKASNGTSSTKIKASVIVNSHTNKDNEFIVTLPTKQVLRFATPKEVHKLSSKFLEEKKAYITCYNKIKELNLNDSLDLINVEYQSDFKKLIFYYYAGFKRIDFRGLIKELFKIYKTRIWLCAVLPYDKPQLYVNMGNSDSKVSKEKGNYKLTNHLPKEYELSNDQILNFSINEFDTLEMPNYFHSKNFSNLIQHLNNEIKGPFYGFNE